MPSKREEDELGEPEPSNMLPLVRVCVVLAVLCLLLYTAARLNAPRGCAVIHIKGSLAGGKESRVTYEGARGVITVEGGDFNQLVRAADRLALLFLGVSGEQYNLNLMGEMRTYEIPFPVQTIDGGTTEIMVGMRSNPSRLGDVPVDDLEGLERFIKARPARFAFAFHPRAGGEDVVAATEVSTALALRFTYLNTTDDIMTFDDATGGVHSLETALEACT